MATTTHGIRLNGPQMAAMRALSDRRTLVLCFGRGVGKSHWMRLAWWRLVSEWEHKPRLNSLKRLKGVRIIVLMPTLKQGKDVHLSGILDDLSSPEWSHLRGKVNQQTLDVTFPGGSWVKFFPGSDYNSRRALGMRADVVAFDEADDIDPEVRNTVALPWLSEPWSLKIELVSGTPRRGRYGLLYRSWRASQNGAALRAGKEPLDELSEADRAVLTAYHGFHATYADAPETVSAETVAKARATVPASTFKREWECDFDAGEGLVYAFLEDFHVRTPPDSAHWSEFWVGVDHGWADPGVFLLCAVHGRGADATLWVLDEFYATETANHIWNAKAVEWTKRYGEDIGMPPPVFACDRSRPDRINDYVQAGVNARPAQNDIEAGVARVAELLAIRDADNRPEPWARLYIHPRCVQLRRELQTYRRKRDPKDPERFLEAIEDRDNHGCLVGDTLVQTPTGEVPLSSLRPGDVVETRNGSRRVTHAECTRREAEILTVELSNGRRLRGTADHPVWVDSGWIRLDALRYGDMLLPWANTAKANASDTAARHSEDTQSPQTKTALSTFEARTADTCTASCGRPSVGRFRTDGRSITETAIRETTRSLTLSACRPGSTPPSTSPKSAPSEHESTSTQSDTSPPPGTRALRGESGIAGTRPARGGACHSEIASVSSAARYSRPELRTATSVFVATIASQRGDASRAWTTSTVCVCAAENSSPPTSTAPSETAPVSVVASWRDGTADVYNISVEDTPEFFAEGVLVHNCDALRYLCVERFGLPSVGKHIASGR